jgi:hypothetical protein
MSPLREEALLAGAVVVVAVAFFIWAKRQVLAVVDSGALNPGNPDNLANAAVSGIVQAATGDASQTLAGLFGDTLGVNQGLAPGEMVDPVSGFIVPIRRVPM